MNLWPFKKKQAAPETLRELIDEYHSGKELTFSTLRKHLHDHSRFEDSLGREPLVVDLTDTNIASYFRGRLVEGRAIRTAECEMIDLRTFWYFAHKKGYVKTKPGPRPVPLPDPRTKTIKLGIEQDEDIASCDYL